MKRHRLVLEGGRCRRSWHQRQELQHSPNRPTSLSPTGQLHCPGQLSDSQNQLSWEAAAWLSTQALTTKRWSKRPSSGEPALTPPRSTWDFDQCGEVAPLRQGLHIQIDNMLCHFAYTLLRASQDTADRRKFRLVPFTLASLIFSTTSDSPQISPAAIQADS